MTDKSGKKEKKKIVINRSTVMKIGLIIASVCLMIISAGVLFGVAEYGVADLFLFGSCLTLGLWVYIDEKKKRKETSKEK